MNTAVITVSLFTGVAVAAGIIYLLRKNKKPINIDLSSLNIKKEEVEGTLCMADVVGFLKQFPLVKGKHTPFIATNSNDKFLFVSEDALYKEGYKTLFIGIYNEVSNIIESGKLVYCKDIEDKLKEVLGNEKIVILN